MRRKKKRNNYWREHKGMLHMKRRSEELWKLSRQVEKVPLEKPQFAGWEISITLTESGKRRKDAHILEKIMEILGLTKPRFTKNVKFIKDIRNNKYSVSSLYNTKMSYSHNVGSLNNRHIRYNEYHNLPENLRSYFYPNPYYKYSNYDKPYYRVEQNFPFYECRLKVTKSYYNFRGIPNSEAISEEQKLDNKMEHMCFWAKMGCRNNYGKKYNTRLRGRSKSLCLLLKGSYNAGFRDNKVWFDVDVYYIDKVTEAEDLSGIYNLKPVDWD